MTPEFLAIAHALAERMMGHRVLIVGIDGSETWVETSDILWKLLAAVGE